MTTRLFLVSLVGIIVGARTSHADELPADVVARPLSTTVYASVGKLSHVTATMIAGRKDAVLIDTLDTPASAHRLVADILDHNKNVTTILLTHADPAHTGGLAVVRAAFPRAKVVTHASVLPMLRKAAATNRALATVRGLSSATLWLDAERLEIRGPVMGDSPNQSYVWIPSIRTVIAGDIVYAKVHPWTADTNEDQRKAWTRTLDDILALAPTSVIAGHKDPEVDDDPSSVTFTKDYLKAFDAAIESSRGPRDVYEQMVARVGSIGIESNLIAGAMARFPAAEPGAKPGCATDPEVRKSAVGLFTCASTALERGDYDLADALATSVIDHYPYSRPWVWSLELRADILLARGRYAEAAAAFEQHLARHPTNARNPIIERKRDAAAKRDEAAKRARN